jgi:hypothetical protein
MPLARMTRLSPSMVTMTRLAVPGVTVAGSSDGAPGDCVTVWRRAGGGPWAKTAPLEMQASSSAVAHTVVRRKRVLS